MDNQNVGGPLYSHAPKQVSPDNGDFAGEVRYTLVQMFDGA